MKRRALSILLALCAAAALLPAAFAREPESGKASTVKVETLIEPIYDEVGAFGSAGGDAGLYYAAVKVDGKWGYIDLSGEMVIAPQYDYADTFMEGVAVVARQLYYTFDYYDWETGESYEVTQPDGCQIFLLSADGRETALQRYYYSSASGSWEYEDLIVDNTEWDDELESYVTVDPIRATWGCYDGVVCAAYPYLPDGTPIIPQSIGSLIPSGHADADVYIPYYTSSSDNPVMWGPCVDGVIPMRVEYYWEDYGGAYDDLYDEGAIFFYMDLNGNITRVFPSASFYASGFDGVYSGYAPDGTGLSVVYYGGYNEERLIDAGYGAMRSDGSWAVPPVYSNFRYFTDGELFSQGLWAVSRDGEKWGAVDAGGKEVIPLQYDTISSFTDDLASVRKDGEWYYIDMSNNAYKVGTPEGGVAEHIMIASHFSGNIAAVYDGERAYCIVNTPVDGVLPAVQGTEELAMSVYFPNYENYLETGTLGLVSPVGEYAAIERDGKWGFLKLTFELENLNPFEDVHLGEFYYDPVQWAVEKGITSGTGGDEFSPNRTCTRAEIVTFLWRAYGEPEPTSTESPFTDVKPGDWYYDAVLWAVEKGITGGTGGGTFNPGGICTRKEAVTFQYRAANEPAVTGGSAFTDVSGSEWYAGAVAWASANGVTGGTGNGQFSPDKTCSRGEIVTFLYRDTAIPS